MKSSVMLRILPVIVSVVLFTAGCEFERDSGLPVDGDGNVYDTVVIGTQVWLKENLKTTRFRDGTPIPLVTDNNKWASMTSAAYCWYNNNPVYKDNYGAIYNWYAAAYACPVGWRLPTKEELETLKNYAEEDAGKLKDPKFWSCPPGYVMDCSGNNETGFSARPGGARDYEYGYFANIGHVFAIWSSTANESGAWGLHFWSNSFVITIQPSRKRGGCSVRCIKDSN
ncbi:MAG TPA: fibrobacter succinogenes major paralogous domain-containing protein [Bacteroidales bacterium]|nr:fibrobacter succinogenes major paralogous domain-containing protein [Bacteroidales bacterium]HPP92417.1 fibrobacter succinogenes major paralogous domain-containing protein [Bacteroidales bacterium]HRR15741.1 fibrobacter succinogenes major paralogous domain-containing protein [Bacteroidales bacterium]HRT47270.1 fibrobacter succinogenes major paralogous domain-containing protein [Bacteroidales bacterium]HRU56210.1 fibrobacter succinogenes major paralogous domain-containing protein [Bacteroidal